jgi:pimeloyl-ACP methyl ester carboxylesterase
MGAFVAVVLAATRPDLVERLVLVDGGLPLPMPPDVDVDAVLAAILGPALARLSQTYESREAYRDFWRNHPALVGHWTPEIEAYVDYDLVGTAPALRSRVSEEATRIDGGEGFRDPDLIPGALRSLTLPIHLLRAERNLANQLPGLYSDEAVAAWQQELPQLVDEVVADTNHYTIAFGARGAALIAARACSTSGQMVPVNPVGESN